MKQFQLRELIAATEYTKEGGQALHIMPNSFLPPNAPTAFKRSKEFAHLFDRDKERLIKTAKQLGVRVIVVEREGLPTQHIDLCGKPLQRAKELCDV